MGQPLHPAILLVDDSPIIRSVIRIYLAGQPFELLEAANAERALQILRVATASLVIADISMPGQSGLDLLRKIRADERPQVRDLPVILLTGERSETVRLRARELGASEFMRKPVVGAGLIEAIRRLLAMRESTPATSPPAGTAQPSAS